MQKINLLTNEASVDSSSKLSVGNSSIIPETYAEKVSPQEELDLIRKCLHCRDKYFFRTRVNKFLTDQEYELIQAAESMQLYPQACCIFDQVVYRLTLRYAELINWSRKAMAKVIEPARLLKADFCCVALEMPPSRGLEGKVAFKVSEPEKILEKFPASVLLALKDTLPHWSQVAYLEPIFYKDSLLRSVGEVDRFVCRPKDPIIAAFLGAGPDDYGYKLRRPWEPKVKRERKDYPLLTFIIAHWD